MRFAANRSLILKIFVPLLLWQFIAFSGASQLVELNLNLRKDTILIGERTQLNFGVIKHKQVKLQDFPLRDSLPKEIEVLDSIRTSSADSLSLRLFITSFSAGQYLIPSIPLVFSYEGNTDTMYSSEILLNVLSPQVNPQDEIKDIKPPLSLPFRLREIIPQTGISIGILLVLVIIILYFVRKMRKKNILEKTERIFPPHIIAFRELDRLKEEKLWQKGNIKDYYSRLADIMRVYLEKRFDIPAMEYVSSETMRSFNKAYPHEEMLSGMLSGILETSDMVKFAKGDPLPAENQANMDNAYLFITQTKIEEITTVDEKLSEMSDENTNNKKVKE
jgi:hypothetical protein